VRAPTAVALILCVFFYKETLELFSFLHSFGTASQFQFMGTGGWFSICKADKFVMKSFLFAQEIRLHNHIGMAIMASNDSAGK